MQKSRFELAFWIRLRSMENEHTLHSTLLRFLAENERKQVMATSQSTPSHRAEVHRFQIGERRNRWKSATFHVLDMFHSMT